VATPVPGLVLVNACAVVLLLMGTLFFGRLNAWSTAYASHLFGTQTSAVGGVAPKGRIESSHGLSDDVRVAAEPVVTKGTR